MKPSEALNLHRDAIRQLAVRYRARRVRVFGSAGRGDDREDSDIDLLVDFDDDATLFDVFALQDDLEGLLHHRVEIATPGGLHPMIRERVLQEAKAL